MDKINYQHQKQNYVIKNAYPQKKKHNITNSILDSENKVTSKELQDNSVFSDWHDSLTDKETLKAIGIVVGVVATAFIVKHSGLKQQAFSLLSKTQNKMQNILISKMPNKFPVIQENGIQYRKIFGKKVDLRTINPDKYQPIELKNNSYISQRIKNPNPTNLYHELKRCNYSELELMKLTDHPNLSRRVGSLPAGWRKGSNNPESLQQIDKVLSEYAANFHAQKNSELNIKLVQEKLSNILGTNVNIKYIGSGKVGTAYKISAYGQDCVYKVYSGQISRELASSSGHGNYAELYAAIKAQSMKSKNAAKFYMGRFGEKDDGYILTKFIPETKTTAKIENELSFRLFLKKISSGDYGGDNVRNGIILDYGLVGSTPFTQLSTKAKKIARELFPILDGKTPDKVVKIAQKYSNTKELEEVKTYINWLIENNGGGVYRKFFLSKKDHLAKLGLDYKRDIRYLLQNNKRTEIQETYGLTSEEVEQLRETFLHAH